MDWPLLTKIQETMSQSEDSTDKPADDADAAGGPVKNLAMAVAGMNSFLSKLAQAPYFAAAKIQLPEWLILNFLSRHQDMRSGQLSRNLGLSTQRIESILTALQEKGLVSKGQDDAKGWKLTAAGAEGLAGLERGVTEFLSDSLAGRERVLAALVKNLRMLSRKKERDGTKESEPSNAP